MSRIFDVIKKTDLIDPGDIAELVVDSAEGSAAKQKPHADPPLPPIPAKPTTRLVSLRVSALDPIFPFDQSQHEAAEQYRIIRTKILYHSKRPRLIALSSASSGDGKTITSINVAASLALKDEASVLLIDADLRRPRVSSLLGIPEGPGLSDVLSGRSTLDEALVRAEQFPNLSILTAGHPSANPAELFDSRQWRAMVEQIRVRFNHSILDTTPVAAVVDYELTQLVCDGVVVVVRPDHTERRQCLNVIGLVPKDKLIGVVLNCVEKWWLWKNASTGYYYQDPPAVVGRAPEIGA